MLKPENKEISGNEFEFGLEDIPEFQSPKIVHPPFGLFAPAVEAIQSKLQPGWEPKVLIVNKPDLTEKGIEYKRSFKIYYTHPDKTDTSDVMPLSFNAFEDDKKIPAFRTGWAMHLGQTALPHSIEDAFKGTNYIPVFSHSYTRSEMIGDKRIYQSGVHELTVELRTLDNLIYEILNWIERHPEMREEGMQRISELESWKVEFALPLFQGKHVEELEPALADALRKRTTEAEKQLLAGVLSFRKLFVGAIRALFYRNN